jgi:hypothetical protein
MAEADEPGQPVKYGGSAWKLEGVQATLFRVARWLFLAPLLLVPPGLLLGLPGMREILSLSAGMAFLAAPALALLGGLLEIPWPAGKGEARVAGKKLVLEQRRRRKEIPRKRLRAGWLGPEGLELETRAGNVLRLRGTPPEEARRLLAEAGLDARQRTIQLQLGPSDFLTALLYLVGPGVAYTGAITAVVGLTKLLGLLKGDVFIVGMFYLTPLLFGLLRGAVQAFLAPARLTIGADGVKIEQNLTTTFLPFAQIRDWTVKADGVTFLLRDGSSVRARGRHLTLDGKGAAVAGRLEEAKKVHLSGRAGEEARLLLARGSRPVSEWRGALGKLLDRGDYRETSLDPQELYQVLSSPEEPAELRLGAALALRERAPAEVKERLRVAAQACANPRLRVAFEALARGKDAKEEDEALLAALEESGARRQGGAPPLRGG